MKNEPTQQRTQQLIAGIGVLHQQRGTLALALANAVAARQSVEAVKARIQGETPVT